MQVLLLEPLRKPLLGRRFGAEGQRPKAYENMCFSCRISLNAVDWSMRTLQTTGDSLQSDVLKPACFR